MDRLHNLLFSYTQSSLHGRLFIKFTIEQLLILAHVVGIFRKRVAKLDGYDIYIVNIASYHKN